MEHELISQMHSHMKFHEMVVDEVELPGIAHPQHVACQKLSCRFHVADVVTCCCMMRTSKQPYPDDDIELVHLERTRFSVKEHEKSDGYNNTNNRLIVWNLVARILEWFGS